MKIPPDNFLEPGCEPYSPPGPCTRDGRRITKFGTDISAAACCCRKRCHSGSFGTSSSFNLFL